MHSGVEEGLEVLGMAVMEDDEQFGECDDVAILLSVAEVGVEVKEAEMTRWRWSTSEGSRRCR